MNDFFQVLEKDLRAFTRKTIMKVPFYFLKFLLFQGEGIGRVGDLIGGPTKTVEGLQGFPLTGGKEKEGAVETRFLFERPVLWVQGILSSQGWTVPRSAR